MKIPSNKQWTQDNSGDTFGVLGDTTNMAFDTAGKARLARKAVFMNGRNLDTGFNYPLAITYYDDSYIVLTNDEIFQASLPTLAFTAIASEPNVAFNSDATVFNSLYTVSSDDDIHTWNGTSWTDRNVTLTTGVPHPLSVFGTQCAVGNGNTVILFTTAYTTSQTLTLPTSQRVQTIRSVGDYMYIGTRNLNGGNARIYVWDGDSSLFNYECEVGAEWVFAMTPYLSTVAAITSQGELGVVNGTTFQNLSGLPVFYDAHARWQGSGGLLLNGKVFNRGMITVGDSIYLNVDGEVDSYFVPEMKSGIWVYDPQVGLYHRTSGSYDTRVTDIGLTLSNNTLTTSATHGLVKGDAVSFSGVSGITGVNDGVLYYVDPVATNQIKLAGSRKALQAGNYVNISGTPTASDSLIYNTNNEAGLYEMSSGAITQTVAAETPYKQYTSEILWGANFVRLTDNTAWYGIFTFADSFNIGSFTTQRIYTDNIKQNWQQLHNFIDGLMVDSEKVVVKAQNNYEPASQKFSGVWAASNILNNQLGREFSAMTDIEEGYEIVIVDGHGRGRTAHVLSIHTSENTVSLTLDESIGTAGQSCEFYYTTFKRVGEIISRDNKEGERVKSALSNFVNPSEWVSLKLELRGFGIAVNTMDLVNAKNQ